MGFAGGGVRQAAAQSKGTKENTWGLKHLSSHSDYSPALLCDLQPVLSLSGPWFSSL